MSLLNDTELEDFYLSLSDILNDRILNINIIFHRDYKLTVCSLN